LKGNLVVVVVVVVVVGSGGDDDNDDDDDDGDVFSGNTKKLLINFGDFFRNICLRTIRFWDDLDQGNVLHEHVRGHNRAFAVRLRGNICSLLLLSTWWAKNGTVYKSFFITAIVDATVTESLFKYQNV